MRILITGATGFVATNLLPLLKEQGHIVAGVDNFSQSEWNDEYHKGYDWFSELDICDSYALNQFVNVFKPDIVFHFAGLVSIYDCHNDPVGTAKNNIIGSINVFNAALEAGCKRVIFSESSAVYEGCILPHLGYKETQSDPTTMYSTSKACVALIAESYARTRGLEYTALRYFNIAGPIQDYKRTVPPLFAGVALRLIGGNNPIIFGDGTRRRDFIHVDDVNKFHLQCLEDKRTINETYNLGTGNAKSLFEISEIIYKYLEIEKPLEYDMMNEINGEAHTIYANTGKAYDLGWECTKTIEDAITDTVDYLKLEIQRGNVKPELLMTDINTEDLAI